MQILAVFLASTLALTSGFTTPPTAQLTKSRLFAEDEATDAPDAPALAVGKACALKT